jgi:hypothetical protein
MTAIIPTPQTGNIVTATAAIGATMIGIATMIGMTTIEGKKGPVRTGPFLCYLPPPR